MAEDFSSVDVHRPVNGRLVIRFFLEEGDVFSVIYANGFEYEIPLKILKNELISRIGFSAFEAERLLDLTVNFGEVVVDPGERRFWAERTEVIQPGIKSYWDLAGMPEPVELQNWREDVEEAF